MKIITKIATILFRQNCILCKQSCNDNICKYCFKSLLKQLIFHKEIIDLSQECDYYYLFEYSLEIRYLLQKFKFQKDLLSAMIFTRLTKYWWDNFAVKYLKDADAMVAIPIHRFKYLRRGFNQAQILADELSQYTKIPVVFGNYLRSRYTRSQSKSSREERINQIKDVFKMKKPIVAKHLLIFDDVLTTGATVTEFIRTIRQSSTINRISVITLTHPN